MTGCPTLWQGCVQTHWLATSPQQLALRCAGRARDEGTPSQGEAVSQVRATAEDPAGGRTPRPLLPESSAEGDKVWAGVAVSRR